jgi:D-3-phosphoglycerate dehydrogenase / 2-oxoglutarate reductase
MSDPVEALIVDLLESLASGSRPYDEVMDAWRTSCPRLPVWEEANARGFIRRIHRAGEVPHVALTEQGLLRIAKDANRPPDAALRV